MRATAAKKQKPLNRHPSKLKKMSAYAILAIILISIMAVLFAFPLRFHRGCHQGGCKHQRSKAAG